jgi:hypothetical protein
MGARVLRFGLRVRLGVTVTDLAEMRDKRAGREGDMERVRERGNVGLWGEVDAHGLSNWGEGMSGSGISGAG